MLRSPLIIGILIAAVVIIIGGVVVLVGSEPESNNLYDNLERTRTEDGAFILGDADAALTVVAFEDFLCPHCQEFTETTIDPFIENYVITGKAQLEYRFFPVVNPTISPYAAQIAECADTLQPGMFWETHDILFDMGRRGLINDTVGSAIAERLHINTNDLLTCTPSAAQVHVDQSLGQQLGVQSTPTIMFRFDDSAPEWPVFNGQPIERGGVNYQTLMTMVEATLAGASQ